MSQAIVAEMKDYCVAHKIDISGANCGEITVRVAWKLRATGAGLLEKASGNNFKGYATDIIAFSDGRIVDILMDGGGANTPAWNEGDRVDASRYRPAIDPGDAPIVEPDKKPDPGGADLAQVVYRLEALHVGVADLGIQIDRHQNENREALNAIMRYVKAKFGA